MSKNNVIPYTALPARLPWPLLTLTMALDIYADLPGWAWGVYGTFVGLVLLAFIGSKLKEVQRPLPGYGDRSKDSL